MVNRTFMYWVASAVATLSLMACATMLSPVGGFSAISEDFAKRLRWMDYQGAAQHMEEKVRNNFLERFANNENLRIIDFHIERVEFSDDGRQVSVWYMLESYMLPSATVKKAQIRLAWEFYEENKLLPGSWRITSDFPQIP